MGGSKQVGSIHIVTSLNTAKVVTGAEQVRAQTRAMARQMKADARDAQGSLALLGEEFGVHLPRQVRRFISSLPGADLISKLLPVGAVAGIGVALFEAGSKAAETIKKVQAVAGTIGEAYTKMHDSAQLANDEMAVTNDRLEAQIAKLTGKRVNNLKLELDEAIVEADKLYKSLHDDNKASDELLDKNKVGTLGRLMGQMQTTDITKQVVAINKTLDEAARAQKDHARDYKNQIEALGNSAAAQQEKARLNAERQKVWDADQLKQKQLLTQAVKDMNAAYNSFKEQAPTPGMGGHGGPSQTANMTIAGLSGQRYQDRIDSLDVGQTNLDDTAKLKRTEEAVEAKKKAQRELGIIVSEMIEDDERYIHEQDRITAALEETAQRFFRLDDEEEKRNRQAEEQAAAAYRKEVEDKVAAMKQERDAAAAEFQEFVEMSQLRVEIGQESESQRTGEVKAAAEATYRARADSLDQELDLYVRGTKEYERVLDERKKLDEEYFKQQMEFAREASEQGVQGVMTDMVRRSQQIGAQIKEQLESAIESVNDTFAKLMSGQYKRGDWTKAGQQVFSGISKTALQDGEGMLLKGLHLGGGGKLGTQGNPMYVRLADPLSQAAGMSSLVPALGGQGTTGSMGGFGSFLASAMSFVPMASGGPVYPGNYLVGEQGPELLQIGSGGFIHNADRTRGMMSDRKSGGGDTHHHYYDVDARGSHNPAEIDRAVQRGIRAAAPHIAAGTLVADRDMRRRKPSMATK